MRRRTPRGAPSFPGVIMEDLVATWLLRKRNRGRSWSTGGQEQLLIEQLLQKGRLGGWCWGLNIWGYLGLRCRSRTAWVVKGDFVFKNIKQQKERSEIIIYLKEVYKWTSSLFLVFLCSTRHRHSFPLVSWSAQIHCFSGILPLGSALLGARALDNV